MSRPQKTLTDYIVIAISPALIMILIGSLIFFLVEAFYQGEYQGRVRWAFGCFVFASVLIGRISIDEGREHATLFAIPLALAMLVVLSRFVEFRGPLAGLSLPLNIGLIAIVLWCADRLTWDCTVIDERKDASGQGLLQTAGLDRPRRDRGAMEPTPGEPRDDTGSEDLDATSSRDAPPALTWWQRFREYRNRPHAPGVWVIYISLAALPLFGLGQRFIPAANIDSRRYAFWMLCAFVASALGLLLNSSFLALRRYLRQRHLEMPVQMAGVWLGTGLAMILVLLLLSAALPRPHPEYSITQLDWSVGSPTGQRPSRFGAGQEGAEDPQRKSTTATTGKSSSDVPDDDSRTTRASTDANTQNGQSPDGGAGESQGDQEKPSDEPRASGGDGQKSKSSSDKGSGSGTSGSKTGQPSSGESGTGKSASGKSASGKSASGKSASGKSEGDKSEGGRSDSGKTDAAKSQTSQPDESSSESAESRKSESDSSESKPAESAVEKSRQQAESSAQEARPARNPLTNLHTMLNSALNTLPHVIKWLYYLVIFGLVAYLVWKYRDRVRGALQGFLDAIRDLLSRLRGGQARGVATEPAAIPEASAPPRPFSAFPDPFASGEAKRWPPSQLVVYTFRALEAWAREHDCPRMEDQTPHEFAVRLGAKAEKLGNEATRLADLYCAAAFSDRPVAPANAQRLETLWKTLKSY